VSAKIMLPLTVAELEVLHALVHAGPVMEGASLSVQRRLRRRLREMVLSVSIERVAREFAKRGFT
jgi:hypothetical protein